jgi:peptidyl-prolyl cis-trans isomerase SurA
MKLKYIFSLALLTSSWCFGQSNKVVIDKVAAQIGDNVVLQSNIQALKLQRIQAGEEITTEMDCSILEELMFEQLLLNQAKLDSIIVQDAQVDAEMENRLRMIEQQIGSRQKMEDFYGKTVTQIKNEFRPIIKDQLLTQEMERKISSEINVTPKEVKDFFAKIPDDSIPLINSKLTFQQIVHFPEVTTENKKEAAEKLEVIRTNILKGKSFETQSRIHSMDPGSAAQGGKISASRGMMVPQFEATVFKLKEGEISEVFETTYGYHIVTLVDRKGDDYTCRHILIIPEYSSDAMVASSNKIDSCFAALKSATITWEQAVLLYSNDEQTKLNKGIITNPITGEQSWSMEDLNQVDQQVFVLTDALEVGGVSSPNLYTDLYERKQGIRIVRLMDRTEPHKANLQDDYALIKKAAENDKKQRTMNDWVKSKIKNAYIKVDKSYEDCTFSNQWARK